jgi:hypothetical protein
MFAADGANADITTNNSNAAKRYDAQFASNARRVATLNANTAN